ncbi:DUF5959 family protein [Nocardioides sp. GCM10030258]|uniref:DUF5959 family protein n=1 Tax=unclassified Nocardioides TaxID=2615069 RepID=UPI00360D4730
MPNDSYVVLAIDTDDAGLKVTVRRQPYTPPGDESWFDCEITVEAAPLVSGTLTTMFTLQQLRDWAQSLEGLERPSLGGGSRRALLGGDRAAGVIIEIDEQQGGDDGALVAQVEVTPSGDDPYPFVRYLIFDVVPFAADARQRLNSLIEG